MPPAINMGTVNWDSSSYKARALSTISPAPRFLSVHFSPARLLPCTSREGIGLDLAVNNPHCHHWSVSCGSTALGYL